MFLPKRSKLLQVDVSLSHAFVLTRVVAILGGPLKPQMENTMYEENGISNLQDSMKIHIST